MVVAALAVAPFVVFGRSARDMVNEDPRRAGGVYYAYPGPAENYGKDVPKNYEAFYVSHYGRHGSRYLISDDDYRRVIDRLKDASDAGALTLAGERLRRQLDTVWAEARGRGGELSPLGARQHRDIARRMGTAYPAVIGEDAQISAASTTIMRCAHSMFAFIEGLKELNPSLDIPRESSERNMVYLNYHSPESGPYSSHKGPYYQDYKRFRAENTHPDRLVKNIFSNQAYVDRWVDTEEFMWDLYWLAVDIQNMETDIDLLSLFTVDELYDLWQTANFYFFARNSSYAPAKGLHTANARNLVKHIVEQADKAVETGTPGATLRFGHDGNIIPLTALMELEGCFTDIEKPGELAREYADFTISPMASNLQLVFFRNKQNPSADVLVRVYLNEHDRKLPVPEVIPNYYRWADVRDFLVSKAYPVK